MRSLIDVLKERQKQINRGYTTEHDAQHTPSQILKFGNVSWTNPTRDELVRAGACILAAIDRMDSES